MDTKAMTPASLRGFLLLLLWAFLGTVHAQAFDRLYADSPVVTLSKPLQWVAVPRGSIDSPDELDADGPLDFQPYTGSTILPTSATVDVWATFAMPVTDTLKTWFIRMSGQPIFKISLYSRDSMGNWQVQSAGRAIAPADWALRTRVPSFALQSNSNNPQTFYLRFEHRQPISERPMLLSPIEYIDGASRVGVVIGLMWGMFSLLAMLCLAAFAMARNRVFLWFGAVVVTLMFTQLVLIGYGGWRLWPHSAHLNQVMVWVTSSLTMAAAAWFCAQASYAKAGHPRIYRLLAAVAIGSLVLAGLMAIHADFVSIDLRNLWLAFAIFSVLGSLIWTSLRGQTWNLLLLLGAAPIALAALARISYNAGWVKNIESAQAAGVLSAMGGLLWVFMVLAWRNRAALFSHHRSAALATYDPATGLMLPRVIESRLPQILHRGYRQRLGCGVMMLRWLDHGPSHDNATDTKRAAALSRIGEILRAAVRDVDTVIRYDENRFMVLAEGPTSRDALSEVATKILAGCLRASDKLGETGAFNLHIAIWHDTPRTQTANDIIDLLKERLRQMGGQTRRPVQFVDAVLDVGSTTAQDADRREHLLASIDAMESSQTSSVGKRSFETVDG